MTDKLDVEVMVVEGSNKVEFDPRDQPARESHGECPRCTGALICAEKCDCGEPEVCPRCGHKDHLAFSPNCPGVDRTVASGDLVPRSELLDMEQDRDDWKLTANDIEIENKRLLAALKESEEKVRFFAESETEKMVALQMEPDEAKIRFLEVKARLAEVEEERRLLTVHLIEVETQANKHFAKFVDDVGKLTQERNAAQAAFDAYVLVDRAVLVAARDEARAKLAEHDALLMGIHHAMLPDVGTHQALPVAVDAACTRLAEVEEELAATKAGAAKMREALEKEIKWRLDHVAIVASMGAQEGSTAAMAADLSASRAVELRKILDDGTGESTSQPRRLSTRHGSTEK